MQNRDGWARTADGPKVVKGKTYKNLVEYTRLCSVCSESFSIFVTKKIALGHADSNSFGLRNCEKHRRSKLQATNSELSDLRTANVTMKAELDGLYERVKVQFEEIQVLRASLAKYELPAALVLGQEQKVTASNGVLPKALPWD